MGFKPVILWTDALIYVLVLAIIAFTLWAAKRQPMRSAWRQMMTNRLGVMALVVLLFYVAIALLDSFHFSYAINSSNAKKTHYSTQVYSLLDVCLGRLSRDYEKTYSAPFALHSYVKQTKTDAEGKPQRFYPRLQYVPKNIEQPGPVIWQMTWHSGLLALLCWLVLSLLLMLIAAKVAAVKFKHYALSILQGKTQIAWRVLLLTLLVMMLLSFISYDLSRVFHIFGTDKIGQDVFYQTLKSIRTGLVIGTLTTLIMLPFAILLGTMAGYFGGFVDDIIQYIYTTLNSIPGVLLIAAAVLSLQIFIANHPNLFPTIAMRADARLLALCLILGITSWTGLCRMLRGETLKLREVDYIAAAKSLGVSDLKIICRHILPNVMHIIIISIVLDFSGLVLAEAVLSYVGVGVDPTTHSWGNMINAARLQLAREPVVWWPLLAAFVFMFVLVLAANLFSDAVRDAFDPRLRKQ